MGAGQIDFPRNIFQIDKKWIAELQSTFFTRWFTNNTNKKAKTTILTLMNDLQVIVCEHETALLALNSTMDDMKDALQYYTALTHDMDIFISSDKQLRKAEIPQLPVLTPSEFLKETQDQEKI